MKTDITNHPLGGLGEKFMSDKDEINRSYRGREREIRLMITDLTYALGLIEGNLGAESVRKNWEKYVDRMWRSRRAEDTAAREAILAVLAWGEESYFRERIAGGWKKPRSRERRPFVTDAKHVQHYIDVELPEMDEAAKEAIDYLARFDPELAVRFSAAEVSRILPVWMDRRHNHGRRGKTQLIDVELCALVKKIGIGNVSPDAMRKQRLAWEKTWHFMPTREGGGASVLSSKGSCTPS